jgi:hypothetical protein
LEPSAGVDNVELRTSPFDVKCFTVACNASVFLDDSNPPSSETVYE